MVYKTLHVCSVKYSLNENGGSIDISANAIAEHLDITPDRVIPIPENDHAEFIVFMALQPQYVQNNLNRFVRGHNIEVEEINSNNRDSYLSVWEQIVAFVNSWGSQNNFFIKDEF